MTRREIFQAMHRFAHLDLFRSDVQTRVTVRSPAPHSALPPTVAPFAMSRAAVADYIRVSFTVFGEMVKADLLPRPRRAGDRKPNWIRP